MSKFIDALKSALTVQESWTGPDKKKHLAAGFAVSVIGSLVTGDALIGLAFGMLVGLGKEVYDALKPETHTASVKDFGVTVLGSGAGAVVGYFLLSNKALIMGAI